MPELGPGDVMIMGIERQGPPRSAPPLRVGLIGSGSMYPLDRVADFPQAVQARGWVAYMIQGTPCLLVGSTESSLHLAADYRTQAEKALDLLSATGAGHYRLAAGQADQLDWSVAGKLRHLHIRSTWGLGSPHSLFIENTDEEAGEAARSRGPIYEPWLHYFRLAQTASDAVYAFQNMWLTFESILDEALPKHSPNRKWLAAALESCRGRYSRLAEAELLTAEGIELLTTRTWKTRNRVFHSSLSDRYDPSNPEHLASIEVDLNLLTQHVIELMSSAMAWPRNVRPQTDRSLHSRGEWRAPDPGLCVYRRDERQQIEVLRFTGIDVSSEPGGAATMLTMRKPIELPVGWTHIDGIALALDGGAPSVWRSLPIAIDLGNIDTISLASAVTSRLSASIRTSWTMPHQYLRPPHNGPRVLDSQGPRSMPSI